MQSSGSVHQPQFHCELRVPGFPCLGSGSASTKKEAQTVAAVKFCQQLVQAGHLQQADIPTTSPARWRPAGKTDPTQSPSTSSASLATSPGPSADKHSCKNELQFLHEFLGKAGCAGKVQFSYEQSGPVHQPVFQCRLAVPGYPDEARGSGGTKKAAQTAAAREFLTQQERAGKLEPGQIPGGESSQRQQLDRGSGGSDEQEKVVVVGPGEGEDPSAELHGGWTLDNAKSYLNYFLQTHNLSMDYKYTMLGNTFVAEMQLWVRELNRSLAGRGTATTKLVASKSCALTLVRQLFHLKVVKAYAETVADKKEKGGSGDGTPWGRPVDVVVESGLLYRLEQHLMGLGQPVQDGMPGPGPRPLTPSPYLPCPVSSTRRPPNTAVRWGPPEPGWDPWRTCTIQTHSLERQSAQLQQAGPRAAASLPVAAVREVLLQEVAANSVTLVCGATGSGKTTQVPQYLLDSAVAAGRGGHCAILCTQPRRVSAVTVSERVAVERGERPGVSTGYAVRFESVLPRPHGSILFCTLGVLLRKLEAGLRGISHLVVDEIHERDVDTDFLLLIIKDMVKAHPQLRVILMSATIDPSIFIKYFGDCPIVEVPGRTFPVQEYFLEDCIQMTNFEPEMIRKKKRSEEEGKEKDREDLSKVCSDNYTAKTKDTMARLGEDEMPFELVEKLLEYIAGLGVAGAVLVFLPGWSQISSLARQLGHHSVFGGPSYSLLPLHSRISREDQRKVFIPAPAGVTKVILSTNIAESSLTIEDVVFVIDSCKVKLKLFTASSNLTQYSTCWASRSSLKQRQGRAGRVRPGFAFHMVSRARHKALEEHTVPEMLRAPLASLGLAIRQLELGPAKPFFARCLAPPPIDAVVEAERQLRDLGAVSGGDELTSLGRILARLPLEPRLGRMLVMAAVFSLGDAAATIAAATGDAREVFFTGGPAGDRGLTCRQRSFAGSRHSDHLAALSAFQSWERARQCGGELRYCESNGLNLSALRTLLEAKKQLCDLMVKCGFPESCFIQHQYDFSRSDPRLDTLLGLLTLGLYPNVCQHIEKRKVTTLGAKVALIHKSSVNLHRDEVNFTFPSDFFVFTEKLRTGAVSCKELSMVSPLHLLLFGPDKVELMPDLTVRLDNWVRLRITGRTAALVTALRPALGELLDRAAGQPSTVLGLQQDPTLELVRELCSQDTTCTASLNTPAQAGVKRPGGDFLMRGFSAKRWRGNSHSNKSRGFSHGSW